MALQSLILPILSVFRSAGLQQASGVLNRLTGNFDSLAGKIGLAAGSFSAFSALTTARQFAIESVNATQQFERNLLALNQVFEGLQPRMVGFTREVENYGLSQQQAAQASVFLGSVLKQYGFSVSETADQTERLVMLAQDLATTYGYDVQEALLAITALFRGEYDPIEKFGVAMKQNEVNARLAAQGLGDLEGAALANAQATARLDMLFERANDSIGAFTRASDTLYASQQRLNAIIGNLQIAFGAPLQRPLAEINNLFADLAQEFGPQVVEIGNAIGSALGSAAPLIGLLTQTMFEIISPLEQLIELLSFAITIVTGALSPAIATLNGLLGVFNGLLDVGSALLGAFGRELSGAAGDGEEFKTLLENLGIDPDRENSLESYVRRLNNLVVEINRASGQSEVFATNLHLVELGMVASATEAANLANKGNEIENALKEIATGAEDADGKLQGLAGVFQRIEEAADQSKAKQAMEELGLSAAFIEEALTRPNWQEIFKKIAYYAKITAGEVQKVTIPGVGVIETGNTEQNRNRILKEINELFGSTTTKAAGTTAKKASRDVVKEFFDGLAEEVQKQTIREQLRLRGASEGLIDAILSGDAYMKVWIQIKQGVIVLQDLQDQFNRTAAGAKELADAYNDILRQQAEYDAKLEAINQRLAEELKRITEKAREARKSFREFLSTFKILPTIEAEVGKFSNQIVDMLAQVESALKNALDNEDITKSGFDRLMKYAKKELQALNEIAKQRDELATRYSLAEGLIETYKGAFTAALNLNTLFGKLKTETEKRTVTAVQSGVVKLGSTLREFGVTVTTSYEETIEKVTDKSKGLLDGFREMAAKARGFAENLRKLREMGLNDQLFNQLVEAGVEASGETAQALVNGGATTISEINGLFNEINAVGSSLGEEVAGSLYGSGVNMADGLLNGIRSKQQELEALALQMAETFRKKFDKMFTEETKKVEKTAKDKAKQGAAQEREALGSRPELPSEQLTQTAVIDTKKLDQLNALMAGAAKFAASAKDATQKAGAIAKLTIYDELRNAVSAGQFVDLGGIRSGLSTAELAAAARAAAPNVFNINVTADSRVSGARAGEAIVESLTSFARANGNYQVGVMG